MASKTLKPQKFYTPEQAAGLLQVNVITIRRWLRSRELGGYKLGRKLWRVSPEQLKAFLDKATREMDLSERTDIRNNQ